MNIPTHSKGMDVVRVTISVPRKIADKMKVVRVDGAMVNWSAVASEAFEKVVEEIEAHLT